MASIVQAGRARRISRPKFKSISGDFSLILFVYFSLQHFLRSTLGQSCFESEKRRVDRHRAFLDLEELNFILKEQKMLMAQTDLKPSAHPDMWPKRGQKAA